VAEEHEEVTLTSGESGNEEDAARSLEDLSDKSTEIQISHESDSEKSDTSDSAVAAATDTHRNTLQGSPRSQPRYSDSGRIGHNSVLSFTCILILTGLSHTRIHWVWMFFGYRTYPRYTENLSSVIGILALKWNPVLWKMLEIWHLVKICITEILEISNTLITEVLVTKNTLVIKILKIKIIFTNITEIRNTLFTEILEIWSTLQLISLWFGR